MLGMLSASSCFRCCIGCGATEGKKYLDACSVRLMGEAEMKPRDAKAMKVPRRNGAAGRRPRKCLGETEVVGAKAKKVPRQNGAAGRRPRKCLGETEVVGAKAKKVPQCVWRGGGGRACGYRKYLGACRMGTVGRRRPDWCMQSRGLRKER